MDAHDLKAKNDGELRKELDGLLREQFNLRMQRGIGQLATPHELRRVRRDIARVRTILNERHREGRSS